jgi:aquaporin Z
VLDELRRLSAEVVGTFALTLVAAGGDVVNAVSGGEVSFVARMIAPGLLVMAFIYAVGDVSGAHFNPAVTLAFAVRRAFPWVRVPGYIVSQLVGATLAALLLYGLFGGAGHVGATVPHHGWVSSLVMEIVLTFLLLIVILGTATRHSLIGSDAAVAVGATIALCGLFAGPVSGASMNPARSFGPALVGGKMADYWIYLAGPVAGASLALAFVCVLHDHKKQGEEKAASGHTDDGKEE